MDWWRVVPIDSVEFYKWLAGLGVGGVIAGLIFAAYRKDIRQYTDLWKAMTEMMMMLVKDNTAAMTANTASVDANTRIVDALHRRLDTEGKFPSRRDPRDEPH